MSSRKHERRNEAVPDLVSAAYLALARPEGEDWQIVLDGLVAIVKRFTERKAADGRKITVIEAQEVRLADMRGMIEHMSANGRLSVVFLLLPDDASRTVTDFANWLAEQARTTNFAAILVPVGEPSRRLVAAFRQSAEYPSANVAPA